MSERKSPGAQIVGKIRGKITLALQMLDDQKTPIEELLVAQIREDAAGTLQKLSRYMPQDSTVEHLGNLTIVAKQYVLNDSREVAGAAPSLGSETVSIPHLGSSGERH